MFGMIGLLMLGPLLTAATAESRESDAELYERMCSSCHSLNPGALAMQGPHLRGVFGRKAGTVRGYPYTPAVKTFDAVWDEKTLYAYLTDPSQHLPGTKKRTAIRDGKLLKRVIKYLKATQPTSSPPR